MTTNLEVPVLAVQGLGKSFAGVKALDAVSVDLYPGAVHGLVGENDGGKSTLIKLMTGVGEAEAGRELYRGQGMCVD